MPHLTTGLRLRDLDPASEPEVDLVAGRMQATLVEVLGEERGRAMYAMEWLRDRVRSHVDGRHAGRVVLAENDAGIVGHTIARLETDERGPYGWFSTIYVVPERRHSGIAVALADETERWLLSRGVTRLAYATGAHHARVIAFFERRGYAITVRDGEMVRLER